MDSRLAVNVISGASTAPIPRTHQLVPIFAFLAFGSLKLGRISWIGGQASLPERTAAHCALPKSILKQNMAPGAGISRALAQHTGAQGESSEQHEPVAVQANQVSRRQHVQVDRERVVFALTRHFDDREPVVSKRVVFDVSKPFEHAFEGLAGGRPACLREGRRSRRRVLLS